MHVEVGYFDASTPNGIETFWRDVFEAQKAAKAEGDWLALQRLEELSIEYFGVMLAGMDPAELVDYLEGLTAWKQEGALPIYKIETNGGLPCIVFTAHGTPYGMKLLALGACFRYPPPQFDADTFYFRRILPRIRSL